MLRAWRGYFFGTYLLSKSAGLLELHGTFWVLPALNHWI
jgi:hypothetical protein